MRKIKLTYDCPKKWAEMKSVHSATNNRECDQCNVELIDFASMSDDELKLFLKKGKAKSHCGHFKVSQLSNNKFNAFQNRLVGLKTRIENRASSFKVVLLFLLGGMMFLSGCYKHTVCGTYLMEDTEKVTQQNENN